MCINIIHFSLLICYADPHFWVVSYTRIPCCPPHHPCTSVRPLPCHPRPLHFSFIKNVTPAANGLLLSCFHPRPHPSPSPSSPQRSSRTCCPPPMVDYSIYFSFAFAFPLHFRLCSNSGQQFCNVREEGGAANVHG